MKKIRVAINGFGRIGRLTARIISNNPNLELVAINDLTDNHTLAHLFLYDSVHRKFNGTVSSTDNALIINGIEVKAFAERDPSLLPWKDLNIDVVLECTGIFLDKEKAGKHLEAGAKKVIISAPAKTDDITTVVLGANNHVITPDITIISNASCTTNCAAPMIKVLHELAEIETAYIGTTHAYTGDQQLVDAPHKDLRRARAAANSIIPTTSGVGKAITKIFPNLEGRLSGSGIRVPVIDGSVTEITAWVKNKVTVEQLNEAFKNASETTLKGILEYSTDPLVSCDIIGNSHSCIFDSDLTSTLGNAVKLTGWYDNEYGYSSRLADLISLM